MASKVGSASAEFIRNTNVTYVITMQFHHKGERIAMFLNVCKHCRKIFWNQAKLGVCPDCKTKDDDLFERIEQYLLAYPNSNALQIAEALKIQAYEVLSFINEGRLCMVKGKFEPLPDDHD